MTESRTNVEKVTRCWGAAAPAWVKVLAEACDARGSSQTDIGKKLDVSGSLISQVLANAYIGRLDKIEAKVRGELMGATVRCPVLGEISRRKCMDAQERPRLATNELRVELRRACPRCPNFMRKT